MVFILMSMPIFLKVDYIYDFLTELEPSISMIWKALRMLMFACFMALNKRYKDSSSLFLVKTPLLRSFLKN
jgi:hypothetical protein